MFHVHSPRNRRSIRQLRVGGLAVAVLIAPACGSGDSTADAVVESTSIRSTLPVGPSATGSVTADRATPDAATTTDPVGPATTIEDTDETPATVPTTAPTSGPPTSSPPTSGPPNTDSPGTDSQTTEPTLATGAPATSAPGTVATGWQVVTVVDTDRPTHEVTSPVGSVLLPSSLDRRLETLVFYAGADGGGENAMPAPAEPRPLIVWAKGLGGRMVGPEPWIDAVVDAGYVVVAPNFPESSAPAETFAHFAEQPGDVSAVLDAILDPTDGVADFAAPMIDAELIGIAGHSMGGNTVYETVFNTCCVDPRIDSALAFGGVWVGGESATGYEFGDTPLLMIHGDADDDIQIDHSAQVLALATGPSHLLTLHGADHFEPVYGGSGSAIGTAARDASIAFFDATLAGTGGLDQLSASVTSDVGTWQTSP